MLRKGGVRLWHRKSKLPEVGNQGGGGDAAHLPDKGRAQGMDDRCAPRMMVVNSSAVSMWWMTSQALAWYGG